MPYDRRGAAGNVIDCCWLFGPAMRNSRDRSPVRTELLADANMRSVRGAFFWSLLGQALALAALLLATIVLARLLNPREMGIYAMGLAVNGILQVLAALGLGTYLTREEKLSPAHLGLAFTINALLAILLAAVTLGLSYAAVPVFGEAGVGQILRLLSVVPIIGMFELLPTAMMQRELRFRPISTVLTLRSIGSMIATIGTARMGASYMSAAWGAIAFAVIGAVGANMAAPGHLRIRLTLRGWRHMAAFGLRVMSIGGFSVLAMRASEIVMGRLLGLPALGIFSRASTIYNVIYANVFGAAARVLLAKLAADNRATGDLRPTYVHGLQITLAVMWPFLLGIALLSRPVVQILFGPQWLAAALPLTILMVAQAIAMCFAMSYELFVLRDELAEQTRYELFRSVCGFGLFTIGCLFSLEAAAVGRLGEVLLGAWLYIPNIKRLARLEDGIMFSAFRVNLLVTTVATAPAAALMIVTGWSATTSPFAIGVSICCGAAAWLLALRVTGHPLFQEIQRMVGMAQNRLLPRDRLS
jgi:O-antigen/teichoic acid export membrane protein